MTGSDDGFLRLWPLDFAHVYLEAEHEGPVTAVDFSADGLKILAGTASVSFRSIIWARSCQNVSYAICEQQRCRSACASAQSDQHHCCSLLG